LRDVTATAFSRPPCTSDDGNWSNIRSTCPEIRSLSAGPLPF
jgi:hypothetical protein